MILDGANDKLQLVTDVGTIDVEVQVSWVENNAGVMTPGGDPMASITSATTTDIVAVPGVSKQRAVTFISARNNHASTTVIVTVQETDGTNTVTLMKATLLAGEALVMDEVGCWTHYDVNGGPYPALGNIASQAEMEAGTSNTVVVTPGRLGFHPAAAKFWCNASIAGTATASYNVTSIGDTGTGIMTVTIATDFSSASYCVLVAVEAPATTWAVANTRECHIRNATIAAGTVAVDCIDNTATTSLIKDPQTWHVVGYGDQA